MAAGLSTLHDRRRAPRVAPEVTPWSRAALLRPGLEVEVVNLSPWGALVESPGRLHPGARTELHLLGADRRLVPGRIHRCRVTHLNPLRYEGAVVFDQRLEFRTRWGG